MNGDPWLEAGGVHILRHWDWNSVPRKCEQTETSFHSASADVSFAWAGRVEWSRSVMMVLVEMEGDNRHDHHQVLLWTMIVL